MFKGLDVFQLEMSFRSWSSFERQSLRLSRELGFSESREAGCPGCGAQVDLEDGRLRGGAQMNCFVLRVSLLSFRSIQV